MADLLPMQHLMSKMNKGCAGERKWFDGPSLPETLSIDDLAELPIGYIVYNHRTGQHLIIEETEKLSPNGSFRLKTGVVESPGPDWFERLLRRFHLSAPPESDIQATDKFYIIGTGIILK